MANRLKYGLHFVRTIDGSNCPNYITVPVADDYANRIDVGDPVKRLATGYVDLAAAGENILGVVDSVKQYYDGTRMRTGDHVPAATSYDTNWERRTLLHVIPIIGNIFRIQCDETSGTYDSEFEFLAFEGENIDLVATGTPPASSNYLADISTHAAASGQLRIIQAPAPEADVDIDAQYVPIYVTGNEATTQWPGFVGTEAGI